MIEKSQPRFVRSPAGFVGGVCQGLGESFGLDPWLIRLFWLLTVCLFGTGVLFYLIAWWTLPRRDRMSNYHEKKILGVCLRLSQQSSMELPLIRFFAVLSLLVSVGMSLLIYLFLHFYLPYPIKVRSARY